LKTLKDLGKKIGVKMYFHLKVEKHRRGPWPENFFYGKHSSFPFTWPRGMRTLEKEKKTANRERSKIPPSRQKSEGLLKPDFGIMPFLIGA